MQENIIIEFNPKTTYNDWIFNGILDTKKCNLDFFSRKQVEENINTMLEQIPQRLLEATIKTGWKMIVTNTRKLEDECGAPGQIYGYTNFEKREILVYADKNGIEISLPHELAHFLDVLTNISISPEWKKIYKSEYDMYLTMKNHFTSPRYASECFADAFMVYIMQPKYLKQNVPMTYKVIENVFEYIEYLLDDKCINSYLEKQKEKEERIIKILTEPSCFDQTYNYL